MTISLSTARILVVSRTPGDSAYMQDFFARIEGLPAPDFVVGKTVPADKYDLIVFDAHSLPLVPNIEAFTKLPDDIQAHYFLLDNYLRDTAKYIVFFGKHYHNLNQERCPSANSKFTLFARIRELIDFINHYKS
ncbi:MAG: hypothetical protein KF734_05915 [Saprospiraceae bacterium]|nr:hypothetical protein [Saprospiraceae bacterium]